MLGTEDGLSDGVGLGWPKGDALGTELGPTLGLVLGAELGEVVGASHISSSPCLYLPGTVNSSVVFLTLLMILTSKVVLASGSTVSRE